MAGHVVLELRDIVKTFPGVVALDGVSLDLGGGEIHALVGENGAGKTTLMNVLAGVYQPERGQIVLDGRPVAFAHPHQAARAGIAVVHQELSLVPNLSVAENIFAHRQPVRFLDLIDWRTLHARTRDLLALFDLPVAPRQLVRDLSPAQRQVVEILKALSQRPRVLVLDEPTSSLGTAEAARLFDNLRRLQAQGVACVYISHHLREVLDLADRVTVLRDGRRVDTLPRGAVTEQGLVRRMVGRELANVYGRREASPGPVCFEVQGASRGRAFAGVSLELRQGEIVGLAGLVGAGRTELGRALAGIEPLEQGVIRLEGQELRLRRPGQAIRRGIVYLTEDRKDQGLFLRLGVRDNVVAPSLRRFTGALGWMRDRAATRFADDCRQRFRIAAPDSAKPVGQLSGGSQQKVLLSMWIGAAPRVLIVDEPTRGVDVGARSEIYGFLRGLAAAGVGILLISSDLQEILGLSDRVLVMRQGRLVAQFPRESVSEELVVAAAAGVELDPHG